MIGSVPWRKVVNTKNFMSCHTSVLNWDDSAVEETFQNAKKRFWSEINGFHCQAPTPDPDIYIDEIDWNPDIDPELMKELDLEFFAPADEGEGADRLLRRNKKTRNSASSPSDVSNTNQADDVNPWGGNNAQANVVSESEENGWGEWNDCIKVSKNVDDDNNPWEVKASPANGILKNDSWGGHENKSNDCVQTSWDNNENPWERGNSGSVSWRDNGWGSSCDKDWGWNREEWNNTVNNNNPWAQSSSQVQQQNKAPVDGGWRDYGREARCGGRQWGPYNNNNNFEYRSSGGRWGASNENKNYQREGSRHDLSGYRNSRFRGDDNQTGDRWTTRGNNRKRVSFE